MPIYCTCVLIASVVFSAAGRQSEQVAIIEAYLRASGLFRDYSDPAQDPAYSSVVQLDLASVVPSLSGPKRPHDRVSVSDMKEDFQSCLDSRVLGGEGGLPVFHACQSLDLCLECTYDVTRLYHRFPTVIIGPSSASYCYWFILCAGRLQGIPD